MRVAIPHMGNIYIPFKSLFERLDIDFVVPPLNSQRTLNLGVKYSPEGLCIPYKLTLGNLIEAAEMGADTMLLPVGHGICRLGYYSKLQKQVLHDLGHDIRMLTLGVSERKLIGFFQMLRSLSNGASWTRIISTFNFSLAKLNALDKIEKLVQKARPRERVKGTANTLFTKAVEAIDLAQDHTTLKGETENYARQLNELARDAQKRPLIIGITGEFYVLLEPFSNLDIERELGKLGVEVRRMTFMSEWTKFSLFLNPLGLDEKTKIHKAASPYLKRDIGGDGWESVGEKVFHAKEYDGLIHLAPFTCMPEIVAENIMLKTKETIPVLTILCDEQLAKPGVMTRLEAFVDLLERRRRSRSKDA